MSATNLNPSELQCATILYAAMEAEFGLSVKTNDPYKARATFYTTRQKIGDATLGVLQIRVSPDDGKNTVWIVRRDTGATINVKQMEENVDA